MKAFFDDLDHPLLFLFFLLLALTGLKAVVTWAFEELQLPGAAALTRH